MNTFSRISERLEGLQNLQKVSGCLQSGSVRNILDFQLGIKILCLFQLMPSHLFFCLASNAFSDIGSVGRIEKKNLKRMHMKSRNGRPWYPRTTLKVNIHIIWINKMENIL